MSRAWLAAGPLVLLFTFVIGVPAILAAVHAIARLIDPEAADDLFMDIVMWGAMTLFVLAPIGFVIYAMACLAKWLLRGNEP